MPGAGAWELAQITGTATDADRQAAIERSYRDLRARLAAESDVDGVSLVDRLINVKAAQANLSPHWRPSGGRSPSVCAMRRRPFRLSSKPGC